MKVIVSPDLKYSDRYKLANSQASVAKWLESHSETLSISLLWV